MFGAVKPQAGGFGGFGAPAPAAFGAAATPSFGAGGFGQPATTAAGFGGFGAAPAAAGFGGFGGFGASSAAAAAPSLFGAPASSVAAFGGFGAAPASTSAFGAFGAPAAPASPSGFGAFGAPGAASASLFSFSAPATSASLFGAPAPAPANPSLMPGGFGALGGASSASMFGGGGGAFGASPGGGLFGAPATPASLFGAAPGGMPGAAPNMFGAPGFQGQQGGANCPSCGPQAAAHQAALTAGQDLPSQELATIHDSYNAAPQNSRYRFRALFYNVVDDPNQRQKPLGVDEVRWRESLAAIGGPNNPERLWPVQASGFSDLEARLNQQEKTIVEDQQFLESIRHLFRERQRQRETTTRERINRMREKHQELQHFLLRIMAKVSALEGLSRQMSGAAIPNAPGEAVHRLQKLRDDMQWSTASLPRRTAALTAAVSKRDQRFDYPASSNGRLAEESVANMQQLLAQQMAAMRHVAEVVKRDLRDIAIMEQEGEKKDVRMDH